MLHTLLSYLLEVPVAFAEDVTTGGGSDKVSLPNPLGEGATIITVIDNIIGWVLTFTLAVVPIFVLIGAFQMVTATGNPEKFAKGQKTIVYAVIGLIIIAAARGLVAIVETLIKG